MYTETHVHTMYIHTYVQAYTYIHKIMYLVITHYIFATYFYTSIHT